MSSTFIIGLIAAVLCCLLGYAFVFQSAEHKSQQKQRLLSAFKQQLLNLVGVAEGVPKGLLTKDLAGLIYHCITDVSEQLIRLDPRNESFRQTHSKYQQLMAATKNQSNNASPSFGNSQEIKNAQYFLRQLHGIIETLQQQNKLKSEHASGYSEQVKELILQTSIEECFLLAKKAKDEGNQKTEALYYQHTIELLNKSNQNGRFNDQISQVQLKKSKTEQDMLTKQQAMLAESKKGHSQSVNGPNI
ncbi:MAG: type II secretion system protein M [Cellvibrionaceae bacterium]